MLYTLSMVMQNKPFQRGGYEDLGPDLGSTDPPKLRFFGAIIHFLPPGANEHQTCKQ